MRLKGQLAGLERAHSRRAGAAAAADSWSRRKDSFLTGIDIAGAVPWQQAGVRRRSYYSSALGAATAAQVCALPVLIVLHQSSSLRGRLGSYRCQHFACTACSADVHTDALKPCSACPACCAQELGLGPARPASARGHDRAAHPAAAPLTSRNRAPSPFLDRMGDDMQGRKARLAVRSTLSTP